MRRMGWIGLVALSISCGPRISEPEQTPVVIVDDSNDTSNATSNTANNDTPDNTATNNTSNNTVTMQQSLEQSGTRYKAKVLQARGGAQTFVGWYDSELEVDCGLSSEDGKCLPKTVSSVGRQTGTSNSGTIMRPIYSDSSCATLLGVSTNGQGCLDVQVGDYIGIRGNETTNCQGQRVTQIEEYAKIIAAYDGPAYSWNGDACEPDDGVERFEIGEVIPRTSIPGWTAATID